MLNRHAPVAPISVVSTAREAAGALLMAVACWAACLPAAQAQTSTERHGAGAVTLAPRGSDAAVPPAPMRTPEMLKRAAPTNQWFSTLIFNRDPEPIYAQPLSVRPVQAGLEVALPQKLIVPTERRDVEVQYPHAQPVLVQPTAFKPWPARLAKQGDWSIDIAMGDGPDTLTATVAHGSPYVSFNVPRGDLALALPGAATRLPWATDARVLVLQSAGRTFMFFGPTGVEWQTTAPDRWLAKLPAGKGYLTAAAAPDAEPASLALLARHAWSVIDDTRVSWRSNVTAGEVTAHYEVKTRQLEGPDNGPLLALYPHHWHGNASLAGKLGPAYATIRGPLKLLAASSFLVSRPWTGFVPMWPKVQGARADELADLLKTDQRNARRMMLEIGNGPYWQGKGLQRIAKLMDVAEQQGDTEGAAKLMKLMQDRIESWWSGESRKTYFHHDKQALGTVVAYPEEYFSVVQMNDHHFHYGYWIRTAAEIALRDPAWAADDKWGAMTKLLIADIATAERGRADFPFLRNFDVYEGHSWASGLGMGPHGNNQESSSEAINAWAGLVLWGEVSGNTALRDLGMYLFTTEVDAISHYWFDIHKLTLPPEYKHPEVSMVFGGRLAHNTWWTDEPRQIKGINLLPITTASTYLAVDAAYIPRSLASLPGDMAVFAQRGKRADPPDIWQDIFAKYLALSNPDKALAEWTRWGSFELGDTRSHALHWMLSLQAMGQPDLTVRADTPLFAVFRKPDGRATYLAYNASARPIQVRFSDGQTLAVPPRSLARSPQP
ncbi:MAG: hypothetical protein CFE46_14555 [Burkholderiales bacterium PBB6]|nr:MAG: hypothetical protein CFE46_14555 [Burkholderiales bacterium PBB6]